MRGKNLLIAAAVSFAMFLSGCALVRTTRCAEITSYGLNVMEPMTGTILQLGYLNYRRIAAPEDFKGDVACPDYGPPATPPKPTMR